jgi:hypothetical protein
MLSPQSGREDISAVIFASSRPKGMHLGRTGLVMSIAAPDGWRRDMKTRRCITILLAPGALLHRL